MRPLEVPRMTKRELLVRLGEEERQLIASLAQGVDGGTPMAGDRKVRTGYCWRLESEDETPEFLLVAIPRKRMRRIYSAHNTGKMTLKQHELSCRLVNWRPVICKGTNR